MMNIPWIGGTREGEYEEKNRVSSFRGYLWKMRRSNNLLAPQWGKRWFSIEGRYLRWYRQESDLCASGMIDLRHVRSITKVEISGSFTFAVNAEDRNLVLRANSMADMNHWVKALHIQADIVRGGTGMNVVSDFNEIPLRSQGMLQRKAGKLRSSLTLQQELDLNLRKLNELELELSMSPQSQRNYSSDQASDHLENEEISERDLKSHGSSPKRNNRSKPAKDSKHSDSDFLVSRDSKSPSLKSNRLNRTESNDSIENIPLTSNRPRKILLDRDYQSPSSSNGTPDLVNRVRDVCEDLSPDFIVSSSSAASGRAGAREDRVYNSARPDQKDIPSMSSAANPISSRASAGLRFGSDATDEFEQSGDSEIDLRYRSESKRNSTQRTPNKGQTKLPPPVLTTESYDSDEFDYIPEISEVRKQEDRFKPREIGSDKKLTATNSLRSSGAKSAWS